MNTFLQFYTPNSCTSVIISFLIIYTTLNGTMVLFLEEVLKAETKQLKKNKQLKIGAAKCVKLTDIFAVNSHRRLLLAPDVD